MALKLILPHILSNYSLSIPVTSNMDQASRFRGRPPRPPRPVSPLDPTLTSRPVPHRRNYQVRSFGQGASPAIQAARPLHQVEELADPATYYKGAALYDRSLDGVHPLLEGIDQAEPFNNDPTWGFYVFVTAYSQTAQDRLSQAMDNWVKLIEQSLGYLTLSAYTEEAVQRLKLDVVADRTTLDGASDDRIRVEFAALLRDLKFRRSDGEDDGRSVFGPPGRNMACFVLDEDAITMLADVHFIETDDPVQFLRGFKSVTVKVVDGLWDRSRADGWSSYRGIGHCSIAGLASLYSFLTLMWNVQNMEDLHPLNGLC